MGKKHKLDKPTEINFDEVRAYLRSDKAGHQDSNPPPSIELLRDSDDEFLNEVLLQAILDVDLGIEEQVHTEVPPVKKEEAEEKKPDWLGRIIKILIYRSGEPTPEELESLLRHIRMRVYKKFIQIQNMVIDCSKASFDEEDITQGIVTSMYALNGFFNYFKATNPEPEKVTVEQCWQRFTKRLDSIIDRRYEKFKSNIFEGILDSSAIKDVHGHHDLGHIGVDDRMSREKISDTIADTEEEDDEDFRKKFEPDEPDEEEET